MLLLFAVVVAVFGYLHIRADYAGKLTQTYIFKPLTVITIIGFALFILMLRGEPINNRQIALLIGMGFCLLGDIFLMLPSDRFMAGLVSFLTGHVLYIAAFATPGITSWLLIGLVVIGTYLYLQFYPNLSRVMQKAVAAYVIVIAAMAWQAGEHYFADTSELSVAALFGFVGALVFMVSDGALAWNRFKQPFHAAQAVVLSTYYIAQFFIAASISSLG